MLVFQHTAVICVIAFMLCMVTTTTKGQQELPIEISPVIISGTIGECSSDDSRQESRSFLENATREIIQNLNTPIDSISQVCGPGTWRRVFYLNASRSDQTCPGQWSLVTSPVRGCNGADSLCRSVFSDHIFMAYTKVCGRITGASTRTPDPFQRFGGQNSIEGNYLDGVSVTHGAPGSRTHIWSFAAGLPGRCPCDSSNPDGAPLPPDEVGDNYFCDRANQFQLESVWTGESCASDDPCCSFNNPPYFSVQLPAATTDSIELRICIDEPLSNEQVLVLFAEMYVQ